MKYLIIFFTLIWTIHLQATEKKLYVGKNSTEAEMKFSSRVQINWKPTSVEARQHIEHQITHLFGPMSDAEYKAVPKGDHQIKNVKIKNISNNLYEVTYDYSGTIVLENGPKDIYTVILPLNPDTVYSAGMAVELETPRNNCTDSHYQSEGDFWYFWNPYKYGCKLVKDKDYIEIKTNIERKKNTEKTYPDYARLVNKNNEIKIDLYFGMDNPNGTVNPSRSKDVNADNYRRLTAELKRVGYKKESVDFNQFSNEINQLKENFSLVNYTKTVSKQGNQIKIIIQIYFGPTGINENTSGFHHLLKHTIENSSVFIYDGHSGLGGHLNLENIEYAQDFSIQFPADKYQIFYFNSCSSYPYYNTQYFMRKKSPDDPKGTYNLDILTNGLSTYFSVMTPTNLTILNAIEMWASNRQTISYQEIARSIDSDNLFGINGDQDNPTEP